MKVRITASGLPVPIGTIMEVGDSPPAAWRGKCEPLIVPATAIEPATLTVDTPDLDFEPVVEGRGLSLRRKRG